jgi:hypothetical protein
LLKFTYSLHTPASASAHKCGHSPSILLTAAKAGHS